MQMVKRLTSDYEIETSSAQHPRLLLENIFERHQNEKLYTIITVVKVEY